jgi:hypothetical protein
MVTDAELPPPPDNLTDGQLRELAADVGYELKMLGAVGPAATPTSLPFLGMALLQTTLLHARNLHTFLGDLTPAEDDVIARHYLPSWTGGGFLTEAEEDDINKRLMHLLAAAPAQSRLGPTQPDRPCPGRLRGVPPPAHPTQPAPSGVVRRLSPGGKAVPGHAHRPRLGAAGLDPLMTGEANGKP